MTESHLRQLKVIVHSSEKFIIFSIGKSSFHLQLSVSIVITAQPGHSSDKRPVKTGLFTSVDIWASATTCLQRGAIVPCSYVSGPDKLLEAQLPPKEAFYNDQTH